MEPLIVCGAGAAGMATALAAARAGVKACLVESTGQVGGTVARALIHTLGGFYDSRGELLQQGLCAELLDRLARGDSSVRRRRMGRLWVLQTGPDLYRNVVETWLRAEPNITLMTRARVSHVVVQAGRVSRVDITSHGQTLSLRPSAVVDATGGAHLVRRIDPELLQDASRASTAGLVFRMRGVEPGALAFPRGAVLVRALRAAADQGRLPNAADKAWIDTGLHEDEAFVKLFVPLPSGWQDAQQRVVVAREAYRVQAAVAAFLQEMPAFSQAAVVQCGRLGVRDGGRVCGQYCLTGEDVRRMRKFEDAACRACWPIEYWDSEHGVSVEYLPENDYYEIPRRALAVRGLTNVWTAGKCLSADPYAHASARVVGTCWAMGEAVAQATLSSSNLSRSQPEGNPHECRSV